MVEYTAPVFWTFMLLVGVSLFVLRWRDPKRAIPFPVPLYPVTPVLFCGTAAYLLYSSLLCAGAGALLGVGIFLAGIPDIPPSPRAQLGRINKAPGLCSRTWRKADLEPLFAIASRGRVSPTALLCPAKASF